MPLMDFSSLSQSSLSVAPLLLGSLLEREVGGHIIRVRIVETEAYDETDAASHSYKGPTPRNDVMFGPSGHLYVYFTYGMHYCCNVVTGPDGSGSAVLIRAVEPVDGERTMQELRPRLGADLSNGPAKLCQALAITRKLDGHDLQDSPLKLILQPALDQQEIVQTTRVGIKKGRDLPWRFYVKDSPYVSKK